MRKAIAVLIAMMLFITTLGLVSGKSFDDNHALDAWITYEGDVFPEDANPPWQRTANPPFQPPQRVINQSVLYVDINDFGFDGYHRIENGFNSVVLQVRAKVSTTEHGMAGFYIASQNNNKINVMLLPEFSEVRLDVVINNIIQTKSFPLNVSVFHFYTVVIKGTPAFPHDINGNGNIFDTAVVYLYIDGVYVGGFLTTFTLPFVKTSFWCSTGFVRSDVSVAWDFVRYFI